MIEAKHIFDFLKSRGARMGCPFCVRVLKLGRASQNIQFTGKTEFTPHRPTITWLRQQCADRGAPLPMRAGSAV
jgi:hypothetical protein